MNNPVTFPYPYGKWIDYNGVIHYVMIRNDEYEWSKKMYYKYLRQEKNHANI